MKLNSIFCSVAALSMMGALASCQNGEEVKLPEQPRVNLTDAQKVSLSIHMPGDELKTRAAQDPTLGYGDDGLFNFTRTIDKLWYAVYNNGTLLYDSTEDGIPQGEYDAETGDFTLDLQIPKIEGEIKLEDYKVFFFAGNAADNVKKTTTEVSNGIGLDFAAKTMYAYPTFLNKTVASGDIYNPTQYDFFAKYAELDKVVDENLNGSVVLTRPFCQISLLSDELCQTPVLSTLATDGKVSTVSTPSILVKSGATTSSTLAYGWNYDTDNLLTKDITVFNFALNANALNNVDGSLTIPQEVTFKSRKMFCLASYLMLAPDARKNYDASATSQQFAFDIRIDGNRYGTDANVAVNIPAGGLKANEKYIVYNKQYDPNEDPDNPSGGDGGIFSNHYLMDIEVDPTWSAYPNGELVY